MVCNICNQDLPEDRFYFREVNGRLTYRYKWCKDCHAKKCRRWYVDHKEQQDEYRRQWVRKRRKTHYRTYRKYELKKKYGVSLEWYDEKVKEQGGVCAICKKPETGVHSRFKSPLPLHVDHNHSTGRVRGLLCQMCNKHLGILENGWLPSAQAYLARYD